jgi:hypothetical protein
LDAGDDALSVGGRSPIRLFDFNGQIGICPLYFFGGLVQQLGAVGNYQHFTVVFYQGW